MDRKLLLEQQGSDEVSELLSATLPDIIEYSQKCQAGHILKEVMK